MSQVINKIFDEISWEYREGDAELLMTLVMGVNKYVDEDEIRNVTYSLGMFGEDGAFKILSHIERHYKDRIKDHYNAFCDAVLEALGDEGVKVITSGNFYWIYFEYLLSEVIYDRIIEEYKYDSE